VAIEAGFAAYQQRTNHVLADYLPAASPVKPLHEAMRYSVLEGGKRLRPLLVYSLGAALGLPLEKLDQAAFSIELIHAYSLIHDDLPTMDNDDCRRGKPSCHKVFGEAIALLAGDALQTLAFEVLLQAPLNPSQVLAMLKVLTKAAGVSGMVGGQAMEFSGLAIPFDRAVLEMIYRQKTGSLFCASLQLAGIAAHVSSEALLVLVQLGNAIGQSYQLQDDMCDGETPFEGVTEVKRGFQRLLLTSLADLETLLPTFSKPHFLRLLSALFSEKVIACSYS
jgi:geranylgeranyl pyrophosphate synthase